MQVILASASPRRLELLRQMGLQPRVVVPGCDEDVPPNTKPRQMVEMLARRKAFAIDDVGQLPVIAADTVVVIRGKVLGKPKDEAEAFGMLSRLSGRMHRVYTGICVRYGEKVLTQEVCTKVYFCKLTKAQINEYIATGEPMDKAGAYGAQALGALLIAKIHGDYFNVVGLPIRNVYGLLEAIQKPTQTGGEG